MFAQVDYPEYLSAEELDTYLTQGWFRIGQAIFTTQFVHFHHQFYSAIWLRYRLDTFQQTASQLKMSKRLQRFRTSIHPASITPEKEALYTLYKQTLPFDSSASLERLLFGPIPAYHVFNIFNTYEVTLHDGDRLIGVGFFDLGAQSGAGIVSVYHPDYKKFSVGKYLILQKVLYCQAQGLQYFYPGYFVPGYPAFDYKLQIGGPHIEFLPLSANCWLPMEQFTPEHIAHQFMLEKLQTLFRLVPPPLGCRVVRYEFFDANLIPEVNQAVLFDFPVMLIRLPVSERALTPVVVFDVRDGQYHLLSCFPVWRPDNPYRHVDVYSDYLLKVREELAVSNSVKVMAAEFMKAATARAL